MSPQHALAAAALTAALTLSTHAQDTAQPDPVTGEVDAVTVFRGQALVSRAVPLPGDAGLHELVVTGLPEHVVPGSLYAEADEGVEVRSVRFRTRAVTDTVDEATRDRVLALDAELQAAHDELAALQATQRLAAAQLEYLNRLANFAATTAHSDLDHGVLDAATLTELTHFLFEEQRALTDLAHASTIEARETQARIATLTQERSAAAGGRATFAREAVVFAQTLAIDGAPAPDTLRLRYLVNHANWQPSYNLRHTTDAGSEDLSVEYQASITQATGEDWANVALTLSTATPSMVANAPSLEPLAIRLVPLNGAPDASGGFGGRAGEWSQIDDIATYGDNRRQLLEQQRVVSTARGNVMQTEFAALRELDTQLNGYADQLAVLDLANNAEVSRTQATQTTASPAEGLSVSYAIDQPVTMPSRPDAQLIRIARAELPVQTSLVATPVLTEFVYRQADAANDSGRVLLAGPMTAFLDGQFVGHGQLPNVAAGESLTVGLGSDPALRATRELVSRTQRTVGGNRVVTFTYRLTVQNFGDTDAALQLVDRLPHADDAQTQGNTRAIVTLTDPGMPLSDDADYLADDHPLGLLRWDVTVPAHAAGRDRFTLEYTYTLEHDRALRVQSAE